MSDPLQSYDLELLKKYDAELQAKSSNNNSGENLAE